MRKVYLDNASTSWPKTPGTIEAMTAYLENLGCNTGRGIYKRSMEVSGAVYETREALTAFFGGDDSRGLIFTGGVTQSLNMVLQGLLKPGDHILAGGIAHNAVTSPLEYLKQKNVMSERIPFSLEGGIDISAFRKMIRKNTKAVVITHECNVCGYIQPLEEIGEICRQNGIFYIVDAAQSGGLIPVSAEDCNIDALCFSGHKGLGGPPGTGGVLLSQRIAERVEPLLYGGTGGNLEESILPSYLPERLEAGTQNIPGIYAMGAAVRYLTEEQMKENRAHVQTLMDRLTEELSEISGIRLIISNNSGQRGHVLSFQTEGYSMAKMARALDRDYGIMVRSGLHCAWSSHQILKTAPEGTIRLSPGPQNTMEEIDYTVQAIREIMYGKNRSTSYRTI